MIQEFGTPNWQSHIPVPVWDAHPEYQELYSKAWELAFQHIRDIPGMPQTPYMDEALCRTQIWIWDSCFMSLYCKYGWTAFPGVETLNNFYEVLYNDTHLPQVIPPEKEPAWTGSTPGVPFEIQINIADNPPLLAWAEYENVLMSGDLSHIQDLLYQKQVLQKHYFWMESLRKSELPRGVNAPTQLIAEPEGYHWEGGRSGMDNTPRGRVGDHAVQHRPNNPDLLWVDAICQQALAADMIGNLYALVGDELQVKEWKSRYEEKKSIVNRLYWDSADQFYYDIDCNTKQFNKVRTIGSYWALTAGIASDTQADAMIRQIANPDTFGGPVPFVSLSRSDPDYQPDGRYWRGSVWLPTAYATLKGMVRYGRYEEARESAEKLLRHMYRTYTEFTPHTIWECYAPEAAMPGTTPDGDKKLSTPDFCGWSALGPISIYLEFILGFHTVNAFDRTVHWAKSPGHQTVGIRNLRFGNTVTDIVADGDRCTVTTNEVYTLIVNETPYAIPKGTTTVMLHGGFPV